MQVSLEVMGQLKRKLKVEVPAQRIESEVEKRLKRIGKTAKIDGFRPGKAPLRVLTQRYGDSVRNEVVMETLQSSLTETLQEQSLEPVATPEVDFKSLTAGKDLVFEASFEVYPQISLPDFRTLKVAYPQPSIGESDVDVFVELIRGSHATFLPREGAAEEGDRVTLNAVKRDGTAEQEELLAEDLHVIVGQHPRNQVVRLAALASRLVGVRRGDRIEFDQPAERVAEGEGDAAVMAQVTEIEQRILPDIDDEFLKLYKAEDSTAFRAGVTASLSFYLEKAAASRFRSALLDALVSTVDVVLPETLVKQEQRRLYQQLYEEYTRGDWRIDSLDQCTELARRSVAVNLIMSEIVRQQQMTLDPDKMHEWIDAHSQDFDDPRALHAKLEQDETFRQKVVAQVLELQCVEWLQTQVQLDPQPLTYSDVWGGRKEA